MSEDFQFIEELREFAKQKGYIITYSQIGGKARKMEVVFQRKI